MRINNILFVVLLLLPFSLAAQQDAHYTQFMFNKLAINPGFAGNWESTALTVIQRNQWVGFEGAPSSQTLALNASLFNNKVGAGLLISHDQIGATQSWNIGAAYSYKVPLHNALLSIGLQASIKTYRVDWSSLQPNESHDPLSTLPVNEKMAPNFGLGVYYQRSKFYAGLSIPNINEYRLNGLIHNANSFNAGIAQRHYYLMAGGLIVAREQFKIKVAGLIKYTANSPVDADLHASVIFFDKLWSGITLRHGGFKINNDILESIDLVLQYQFAQGFRLGLAYDFSLSEINQYHSGTYELMAFFQPFIKKDAVQNPRFF